jgi:hypothetical protein
MDLRRAGFAVMVFAGVVFCMASVAGAGGFQQMLFRGLEYVGNPNYLTSPQNGPLYNFNRYTQQIQYNRASGGYTFESFRSFGPDSFGNPNTLDLGPLKIQLGTDPALIQTGQPTGILTRAGYSTTILPEVTFDSQSGQNIFNQFSGISSFSPSPLNYTVTLNTGVQDYSWTGNALLDAHGSLNAMGFYDFQFNFVNVGNYTADGVLVKDEQVTDFDLGPIDVSGNLLMDAIGSIWQATGATEAATVPRILDDASQKDKLLDSLLARLRAGETLSDEDMQYVTQKMIEAAFRADPLGVIQNGVPAEVAGFEGLSISLTQVAENADHSSSTTVPEPGTLVLVASAAAVGAAARRWQRRRASRA